jgi:DNA-binding MltR family transcriptional regulator
MGLISEDEAKDLNRVREIRNKFAHHLQGLTFTNQSIRESCKHFRCVAAALASNEQFAAEFPPGARFAFNFTTALLAMHLTKRIARAAAPTAAASPW